MSILTIISITYILFSAREVRSSLLFSKNKVKDFTTIVWTCPRCFTFWIGLILTQDITTAAIASIIIDIYDRYKSHFI